MEKTKRPTTGTPAAVTASRCEILSVPGSIVSGGTTIADLATYLSPLLDRVVQDRTALAGNFEYTLHWTPENYSAGLGRKADATGLPPIDENGPSLPTALREQLGIKLDSQKGPVNVLVIQRVERLIPR